MPDDTPCPFDGDPSTCGCPVCWPEDDPTPTEDTLVWLVVLHSTASIVGPYDDSIPF